MKKIIQFTIIFIFVPVILLGLLLYISGLQTVGLFIVGIPQMILRLFGIDDTPSNQQ